MNRDSFDNAIHDALIELQKAYPAITNSFIFKNNGAIITKDKEIEEKTIKPLLETFESLKEKSKVIGTLSNLTINGKKGKLVIFKVNSRFFGVTTISGVKDFQIEFITHTILPPFLKTLEKSIQLEPTENNISEIPSPNPQNIPERLQSPFTKTLLVDPLSGFFDGKAAQIDEETLDFWNNNDSIKKQIDKIKIETPNGKSKICRVKKINDKKLKGKNKIRIPSKICNKLNLKQGDKVNISPKI